LQTQTTAKPNANCETLPRINADERGLKKSTRAFQACFWMRHALGFGDDALSMKAAFIAILQWRISSVELRSSG